MALSVWHHPGPKCIPVLQVKFPGSTLNITVDKLEGKSLQQQAALYYNTSIVIQTHGAALGVYYGVTASAHEAVCIDGTSLHKAKMAEAVQNHTGQLHGCSIPLHRA